MWWTPCSRCGQLGVTAVSVSVSVCLVSSYAQARQARRDEATNRVALANAARASLWEAYQAAEAEHGDARVGGLPRAIVAQTMRAAGREDEAKEWEASAGEGDAADAPPVTFTEFAAAAMPRFPSLFTPGYGQTARQWGAFDVDQPEASAAAGTTTTDGDAADGGGDADTSNGAGDDAVAASEATDGPDDGDGEHEGKGDDSGSGNDASLDASTANGAADDNEDGAGADTAADTAAGTAADATDGADDAGAGDGGTTAADGGGAASAGDAAAANSGDGGGDDGDNDNDVAVEEEEEDTAAPSPDGPSARRKGAGQARWRARIADAASFHDVLQCCRSLEHVLAALLPAVEYIDQTRTGGSCAVSAAARARATAAEEWWAQVEAAATAVTKLDHERKTEQWRRRK